MRGNANTALAHRPTPRGGEHPAVETAAPRDRNRPASILVVDDVEDNRVVLGMMLSMAGYEVETAEDARSALAALSARDFDLALVDVSMPEFSGHMLTGMIRDKGVTAQAMPIIAVTASVGPGAAEACLESGMQGYLPKPITMEQLTRTVGAWLS